VPQLVTLAARGPLLGAVLPASDQPVFAGIPGGMWQLTDRLAEGLDVRLGSACEQIHQVDDSRDASAHSFVVDTADGEVRADAVIVATPAGPAARLLGEVAPAAAIDLSAVETATVAVVTFAFRAAEVPTLDGATSGFLVPPVDGRRIKASTFSFAKWDWVRRVGGDLLFLRTSLGRFGEALSDDDEVLVRDSLHDLAEAVGVTARPVAVHVQRWVDGLPQYHLGHLDRVARIRAALPRGIAVAGAVYDGVGIPAVIGSAHRAVADLVDASMEP
jgi:oxygen-dependent protoporphyrinogen oxidase